jgi:uncharacterized repeat protein (TIGR02543 family)
MEINRGVWMRKIKQFGIITLVAVVGFSLVSCRADVHSINETPVASDFEIGNLTQFSGNVTPVTITPKAGKSTGAITIYYGGSTTLPTFGSGSAGSMSVTFDVAAATGWNAATRLHAGFLEVNIPRTPGAWGYIVGNLNQIAGSVTAVTITADIGWSPGAIINIRYDGDTTIPQAAGIYSVTFDVAAATGWNAATGLYAGTLIINDYQTPVATDFDIGNLTQTAGSVMPVTIMPQDGKSTGTITIFYNGSTTLPTAAGTYLVTFDVAASTGWDATWNEVIWSAATGLVGGTLTINPPNQTPVASHFNIGNLTQTAESITPVTIIPLAGRSTGAITIFYNGSTTLPTVAGTYTITFNVAASTGWNAVTGLAGGTLTIQSPTGITINLAVMNEWELVDQTAQVAANTNRVFSVTGSYTTFRWFLDGVQVGTSSTYTFNRPIGVYQLVVIVTNSAGESRSARCWVTVTATPPTFTITYNINGGTGTTPTAQTVNSGNSVTLANGTGFSRSGFTFGGWNTNAAGTGTNYNAGASFAPTGNITLFARWTSNTPPPGGITLTQSSPSATVNITTGVNGRVPVTVTAPAGRSVTLTGQAGNNDNDDPALYNGQGATAARLAYQNNGWNFTYTIPAGQTQTVFAGTGGNVARSYVITATFN